MPTTSINYAVGIPITDLAQPPSFELYIISRSTGGAVGSQTLLAGLTTNPPRAFNGCPRWRTPTNCFPMIQIPDRAAGRWSTRSGDYQDLDFSLNAARPFVKAAYRIGFRTSGAASRFIRTATSAARRYTSISLAMLGQAVEASAASGAIWRPVDPAPGLLPALRRLTAR